MEEKIVFLQMYLIRQICHASVEKEGRKRKLDVERSVRMSLGKKNNVCNDNDVMLRLTKK